MYCRVGASRTGGFYRTSPSQQPQLCNGSALGGLFLTESIAGCIRGAAAVLRGGEILDFDLLVWKVADRLQLRGNVSFL